MWSICARLDSFYKNPLTENVFIHEALHKITSLHRHCYKYSKHSHILKISQTSMIYALSNQVSLTQSFNQCWKSAFGHIRIGSASQGIFVASSAAWFWSKRDSAISIAQWYLSAECGLSRWNKNGLWQCLNTFILHFWTFCYILSILSGHDVSPFIIFS